MGGALELDSRLTQARLKLDWDSELTNSVFEICWQLASKLLGIPIMIDVRSWGSHVCSRERAGGRRLFCCSLEFPDKIKVIKICVPLLALGH